MMHMSTPIPAVFLGHGNPTNAIENNDYTKEWAALGRTIPKPEPCSPYQPIGILLIPL
jgi:aromatic ring-opening dioxygenase catalytic subunit (LigB family)